MRKKLVLKKLSVKRLPGYLLKRMLKLSDMLELKTVDRLWLLLKCVT